MLAPVCLFTYNRLDETKQTVEALKDNFLASESQLFIFSDGPKNSDALAKVHSVREWLKTISGFKSIVIIECEENQGLANSIINGVSKIINDYGKVIVLEDDLITASNFLSYMNEALDYYKQYENVSSISGYTPINFENLESDVFFSKRSSSWGWATWKHQWNEVDWDFQPFKDFPSSVLEYYRIFKIGSNLPKMIKRQNAGKVNSWAIRFLYYHFKSEKFTVFPIKNKIRNIGIGGDATHTIGKISTNTQIDNDSKVKFDFTEKISDQNFRSKAFYKKYSLTQKISEKLLKA